MVDRVSDSFPLIQLRQWRAGVPLRWMQQFQVLQVCFEFSLCKMGRELFQPFADFIRELAHRFALIQANTLDPLLGRNRLAYIHPDCAPEALLAFVVDTDWHDLER